MIEAGLLSRLFFWESGNQTGQSPSQPCGLVKVKLRVAGLTLHLQHETEVVMGTREIRLSPERRSIVPYGVVELALAGVDIAEIVMRVYVVRINIEGSLEVVGGLENSAQLEINSPEKPGVIRTEDKYTYIVLPMQLA